jgi:cytochrome bd-type quinol oxidase subunit 2
LRATAESFWVYAGLDIAMGAYIDLPETRWGEMFLPERLMQGLQSVVFSGAHGTSALVKDKHTIYEAKGRPAMPPRPPDRTWAFLQGGLGVAALFTFLGWEAYRRRLRWARVTLGVLVGATGLILGTLGTLFVLLWAFTNHQVAFRNENILQCAPWALGLTVLSLGAARANPRSTSLAFKWAVSCFGAALLGLVLKVFPFMMQDNSRIMAALIPSWAGVCVGLYFLQRRISEDTSKAAAKTAPPAAILSTPSIHASDRVEHPQP